MTTEITASRRGGRRPGAGRKPPPDGNHESHTLSLSPAMWQAVDEYRQSLGLSSQSVAAGALIMLGLAVVSQHGNPQKH
jgi:hypothetical protein